MKNIFLRLILFLGVVVGHAMPMSGREINQEVKYSGCSSVQTTVRVKETCYLIIGFSDGMMYIQSGDGAVYKSIDNKMPIQFLTALTTADGETFIITVNNDGRIRVRDFEGALVRDLIFETGNLFVQKTINEQIKAVAAFQRHKKYDDELHDNITIIITTDRNAYFCASCRLCARGKECPSSYWCSHWGDLYLDYFNPNGVAIDAVAATKLCDGTGLLACVIEKSKIDFFRTHRPNKPSHEGAIFVNGENYNISGISFIMDDNKSYLLITFENNNCAILCVDNFPVFSEYCYET